MTSGFAAFSAAQSALTFSLVPETEKTSRGRASPTKVRCKAAMASPIGSKSLSEPERAEALPSIPGSGGGGSGSGANGEEVEPFEAPAVATPLATELKKLKAPENGLTESGLCTMMR